MKIRNLGKIGDFGRTKNDILDNIFLVSLQMYHDSRSINVPLPRTAKNKITRKIAVKKEIGRGVSTAELILKYSEK